LKGFELKQKNGVNYFTIPDFENSGMVRTCFSTRRQGVSKGGYSSLNVGLSSGDLRENVIENINIICDAAGFNIRDIVLPGQVHGSKCSIVKACDRGKGVGRASDIKGVDALITSERDVAICILTADCVPVFLFDEDAGVIAICHAGWRGIIYEIIPKTILKMAESFSVRPEGIKAAIGPSIGPCCFEVKDDVKNKFQESFGSDSGIINGKGAKWNIDLWKAACLQLENAGIKQENIIKSNLCTCCNKDYFYSYRRDGSKTGRMISMIELI
jgi:YfiH family protein